jgi:TP901 family phage tail tape measure protein
MAFDAGAILARLGLDTSQFNKGIDQTKKKAGELDGQTKKTNKLFGKLSATTIGLAKTFGASLAIGTAITAFKKIVTAASDFEKGMANVATLVDTTKVNMEELGEGVSDMSVAVTKSTDDLSAGLFQVISAGVDSADALDVLEVAARAASAGVTDTASSVKAITGILNAYGLEANEATKISDLLFQTNKFGVTTFGELANSVGTVIPTAAALGIKLEDLFAAIATLTKANIDTATATTSLRAVFVSILKPADQAKKVAKELGLEWNATALTSKGLVQFINDMKEATKGNTEQMAALIPESRALTAVLALAGEQAGTFNEIQREMQSAVGVTTEAFEKQEKTLDSQIKKVGLTIEEIKRKIGRDFLPAINSFLKGILKVYDEVEKQTNELEKRLGKKPSTFLTVFFPQTVGAGLAREYVRELVSIYATGVNKLFNLHDSLSEATNKLTEDQREFIDSVEDSISHITALKELGGDYVKALEGIGKGLKTVEEVFAEALIEPVEDLKDLVLETQKVVGATDDWGEALKRLSEIPPPLPNKDKIKELNDELIKLTKETQVEILALERGVLTARKKIFTDTLKVQKEALEEAFATEKLTAEQRVELDKWVAGQRKLITEESFRELGLTSKEAFQGEVENALTAFRTIVEGRELSNEEMLKVTQAFFENIEGITTGIDPAKALFDIEEIVADLDKVEEEVVTSTTIITNKQGDVFKTAAEAVKGQGKVMTLELKERALTSKQIFGAIETNIRAGIGATTQVNLNAIDKRANAVQELFIFEIEGLKFVTDVAEEEFTRRNNAFEVSISSMEKVSLTSMSAVASHALSLVSQLSTVVISQGGVTTEIGGSSQTGGIVPQTGLFELHKGEVVVNPALGQLPTNQTINNTFNVAGADSEVEAEFNIVKSVNRAQSLMI